jgi:hypothetical protein
MDFVCCPTIVRYIRHYHRIAHWIATTLQFFTNAGDREAVVQVSTMIDFDEVFVLAFRLVF